MPDVLSRWAYPAAHAAPDVSIMSSEEDVAGLEADEREERLWADSQMARGISAEFCQQYGIWYRQFRHVFAAHDCLHPRTSSAPSVCCAVHRVHQEEPNSSEIEDSWLRNLRDRFAVPSRMCRIQKKQVKAMYRNLREQDWSHQRLLSAYACVSDALWANAQHFDGPLSPDLTQVRNLIVAPAVSVLFSDWTAEYQSDPYWSGVHVALRHDDPAVQPPAALESFGLYKRRISYKGKYAFPASLIQQIILACHSYVHGCFEKTLRLVDRKFHFNGLTKAA